MRRWDVSPLSDFWDNVEPVQRFISFNAANHFTNKLQFLDNEPTANIDKYGNQQSQFNVITEEGLERTFAISSKRLIARLKVFLPLAGKWFRIQRTGMGFDTDYIVELDQEGKSE